MTEEEIKAKKIEVLQAQKALVQKQGELQQLQLDAQIASLGETPA